MLIGELKERLEKNRERVAAWFSDRWSGLELPLYLSVDLRHSGYKAAVVDTNAFPAGFNNLCPAYARELPELFRDQLTSRLPSARRVLIFPEPHTRNHYYLENLRCLEIALTAAGYEVRIGTDDPAVADRQIVKAVEGELVLNRIERRGDRLFCAGFEPDLVLSNNDFSGGAPELLRGLALPVLPGLVLGWGRRRKHRHFRIMNELIEEFAPVIGIDPWLIRTRTAGLDRINFNDPDSRERLAREVDRLLEAIAADYRDRRIKDEPFVFIKHNASTYGMAVMTARSGDEVRRASHKTRTKMLTGKGKAPVTEVLIQEGVPTRDQLEGAAMEPVIYMIGDKTAGGFFRLHRERGQYENLNVRGMEFRRLCFHKLPETRPELWDHRCEDGEGLLFVYGGLARLAALSLAREQKEMEETG